ncbi:MAG: hypothetical protein FWE31_03835 [Firmicutes bacterium]|nr:hypothetical protein [Bacillota bacterium]
MKKKNKGKSNKAALIGLLAWALSKLSGCSEQEYPEPQTEYRIEIEEKKQEQGGRPTEEVTLSPVEQVKEIEEIQEATRPEYWRQFAEYAGLDLSLDVTVEQLIANVQRLRDEMEHLREPDGRSNHIFQSEALDQRIGTPLAELDPLLVGRNIVFSPQWLEFIGQPPDLTPPPTFQQFAATHNFSFNADVNSEEDIAKFMEKWEKYVDENFAEYRENTVVITEESWRNWVEQNDQFYEGLAWITGTIPNQGQKIFIDILGPHSSVDMDKDWVAVSLSNRAEIVFRPCHAQRVLQTSQIHGGVSFTMPHEISHQFDYSPDFTLSPSMPQRERWNAEAESLANFKIPIVMNMLDLEFHASEHSFTRSRDGMVTGDMFRESLLERVESNIERGVIEGFAEAAQRTYSAFDKYLHALAEKVGYEPIMLAFHSYSNIQLRNLIDEVYYANGQPEGMARELLSRIAMFAGQPQALLEITGGELLNEHFSAESRPRDQVDAENIWTITFTGGDRLQWVVRPELTPDMKMSDVYADAVDRGFHDVGDFYDGKDLRFFLDGQEIVTISDLTRSNPRSSSFLIRVETEQAAVIEMPYVEVPYEYEP